MSQPKTPIVCSRCQSENVSASLATLCGMDLVNLMSGQNKYDYHCNDCHFHGHTWA